MGIASLGGATLDNEENYLIKKLLSALGVVQVENQARVCHSSTVSGLGTSFGRGGATMFLQDLQNSDCIIIEGSNFAEAHPVGFQWVMEAKARGAVVIHVDPRFSRTSALADLHVPIRAGTDIAFLGGIINHVLTEGKYFEEYVKAFTNAATIVNEDFRDTEDLDGLFSGYDEADRSYDVTTWGYDGVEVAAAAGDRNQLYKARTDEYMGISSSGRPEQHGSGGAVIRDASRQDETLQDPNCVFQILKRHYSRYTPEKVEEICGIPEEVFLRVCEHLTENSGRDRTSAFCYAVGWTQHTVGVQYIRTAAILQLLLGNIGRPGGGIMALRGHVSIQGSSDVPTLFDLLPGYLPMPHADEEQDLDSYVLAAGFPHKGFWSNMEAYTVSLLKAWWGEHATAENDYCFDHLPRLTGSHSTYDTVMGQMRGECKGYFLMGENPAVGSANTRAQRMGMANLEWLVVRDFSLIESATWWKDGPEIDSGENRTEDIGTEVFFFPASAHTEKSGTFTNTNRTLQWHDRAVRSTGEQTSDLWFMYRLGELVRERLADSDDPKDRPVKELTWDYPLEPDGEPDAAAILREINGHDAEGRPLGAYTELKSDGSTSCGCWIYCGVFKDGVNQSARKKPGSEQDWIASEWAWSWPDNRRILYNRASADEDGQPWSPRKTLVWWDTEQGEWTGHDTPDFEKDKAPDYRPPEDAKGVEALSGRDAFIMQSDGKGWLYAPAGLNDGPMPTHYEPQDTPFENLLYTQGRNPTRLLYPHEYNLYHPEPGTPEADIYPFVVTTYRVTEHHTAGGMSRWTPYLSELQPEFFCEVSPELAAERGLSHKGWATLVTARNAIEARVMVTDRMAPLRVQGRTVHQIGMPYHWGPNGYSTGDSANELMSISLDPNVHIQEVKALTADIRPGRRPRGPERLELVRSYRRRARITESTGTEE